MPTARLTLIALMLLASASILRADREEQTDPDEVPVVGRPSDLPFSEASGWFEVQARAEPTTLEAETLTTFILSVHATRDVRRPPQRIDLRQLPAFADQFHIEETAEELLRPDARTWEFVYRLKPRRIEVSQIPSLPFVYFNPYILSAGKRFQVIYTDPIPLQVLPRETVQVPVQAPEGVFALAAGSSVLARQASWHPPGMVTIGLLLVVPPLVCAVWYISWRRRNPDAARLIRQRRSRAARHALQMLQAIGRVEPEQSATRSAAIVAGYLRQRLDLAITEPTPHEIADFFAQRQCSPELAAQAVRFFETCDRARFLPASASEQPDLPDSARQFILAVEEEMCPTAPS
jgi:hypothetical protein